MAYFRNNTVNLINLHFGIHAITLYGAGAFFFAYLLKAGVPLPLVFVSFAAILAGRFVLRPSIVPLAARFGIRPLLIAGTLLTALQFPLLATVQGVGSALIVFCAVSSVGDILYWTTYHAYFAALGDHEHRGHQLGVREAVSAIVGIVSPLATAWALVNWGAFVAFGAAATIQIASVIPLLYTPNVPVARHVPGAVKASLPGVWLFLCDGWIAVGYLIAWQIALFLSLGEDFVAYGGALALTALAGAAGGLILGRHIDAGHGRRAVWIAFTVLAVTTVFRSAATGHAGLAIAANAMGALVACFYTPTLMTAIYNLAKASPCPLRFHVATEGGWDAGGASACLVIALLLSLGLPLAVGIALSLVGGVASLILLRRYYAHEPAKDAQARRGHEGFER